MFSLYLVLVLSAVILKQFFKDVSRELDELRVNTHLCKLRCWSFRGAATILILGWCSVLCLCACLLPVRRSGGRGRGPARVVVYLEQAAIQRC